MIVIISLLILPQSSRSSPTPQIKIIINHPEKPIIEHHHIYSLYSPISPKNMIITLKLNAYSGAPILKLKKGNWGNMVHGQCLNWKRNRIMFLFRMDLDLIILHDFTYDVIFSLGNLIKKNYC